MSNHSKVPIGSLWRFNNDKKERIFEVIEKKPFGKISLKQIDRAYFGENTQKGLLSTAKRVPRPTSE